MAIYVSNVRGGSRSPTCSAIRDSRSSPSRSNRCSPRPGRGRPSRGRCSPGQAYVVVESLRLRLVKVRMEDDLRAAPNRPANGLGIAPALVADHHAERQRTDREDSALPNRACQWGLPTGRPAPCPGTPRSCRQGSRPAQSPWVRRRQRARCQVRPRRQRASPHPQWWTRRHRETRRPGPAHPSLCPIPGDVALGKAHHTRAALASLCGGLRGATHRVLGGGGEANVREGNPKRCHAEKNDAPVPLSHPTRPSDVSLRIIRHLIRSCWPAAAVVVLASSGLGAR